MLFLNDQAPIAISYKGLEEAPRSGRIYELVDRPLLENKPPVLVVAADTV